MTPTERKHNEIIKNLESRIKNKFLFTYSNLTYFSNPSSKSPSGEIDFLGYRNSSLYLFQIKTNHTDSAFRKAKKQLKKDYKHYVPIFNDKHTEQITRVFKYYVTMNNNKLHVEYIQ